MCSGSTEKTAAGRRSSTSWPVGFSVAGALLIFAAVLLIEGVLPYDPIHYARRLLGQCVPLPVFALLCDAGYADGKAYYGGRSPSGWAS
ncbi:hypothetical protein [Streptomyces sp. NPDC058295]|uniref:hypothetical protein n=1 Tax=Streptomyces sp. NPDC058295 TaxID=3346431 RepID=UPI0036E8F49C